MRNGPAPIDKRSLIARLSEDDHAKLESYFAAACADLQTAWDSLHEMEHILHANVPFSNISGLLADCDTPEDAQRLTLTDFFKVWEPTEAL
jgi:hypothetical protein